MRGYPFLPAAAKRCRPILRLALLLCCCAVASAAFAQPETDDEALAKSIVEKADEARFPKQAFEVTVDIASTLEDGTTEARKYRILSKGNQNTIVMALEPASERGQALLMKGRDLWIFMPSISQPVRLSLAQRLTGQVANGDLARANFSGDYTPKILRTETIDGEAMYVLELTAEERGVTYHRVVYWVRQSNSRPYKAEFYSLSDHLLKTCLYQDYRQLAGRMRPTRLVMEDALHKGETSVLEYRDMRLRELPDKMFTKDYLKHLD
jgi:outer membrane lipoprotein-sorting protein